MSRAGPISPHKTSAADRALLDDPATKELWNRLAHRFPERHLTPDADLERDFGFDSMEWLHLALELEQHLGLALTDEAITRASTLRDLLQEVTRLAAEGQRICGSFLDKPEAHLRSEQKRWLEPLGSTETRFATAIYHINRRLMRSLFSLRVEGLDLGLPRQAIFAPTHGSFLDPFALAATFGRDFYSRTFWAADATISFGNPVNRRISRLGQAFPFDAGQGFVAGMASAAAVLKGGYSLVWFPEGWRSRSTQMREFKPGIGMLLKQYPVPVVPIAIRGAHEAFPPGRVVPRFRRIAVGIGKPLDPVQLESEGEGATHEERIAAALRRHTADLYDKVGNFVPC